MHIPACSKVPSAEVDSYCIQLPLLATSVRHIEQPAQKLTAAVVRLQRRFAPKTSHSLHSEFHQSSDGRSSNLDSASVAAGNYKQPLDVMDGKITNLRNVLAAFSPKMGSKIRIKGFES
jgi:hypothetical protein